ncbi:D-glycero-beta-D-manno-heptose-1,7-bisphosphate 7-phosphatase [bacterium BMS3Bbin11]|nr:D-glycero-beta-D-manno-heptose-1,7-bisphosphate 7-phosphatase [bacterium BMS3Abin11]GBE46219.1 D-glycero-beta-D-manno-heptose-1,7-bisphosphate 7-phosphatase [bacterium BMS3Bbin11]GMT41475.1 MAG: D,D-heptose 1,7-bisphosphate phosphatase [bacterium]HDH16108.1 D-glycero-beta-D-manno-heptose 1,7-bisphosphate 7-phosphatase [Gammaproteobacteria bacterium]
MKTILLDRDGVINQDSCDFIKSVDEWRPIPGSLEAIALLHRHGYRVVVITNQSGVARGLFSIATLNEINRHMLDETRDKGGLIEAVFFCPHGPDDNCICRKPATGMFHDIAARLKIEMSGVPAVGDSMRDLQAAQDVGALPVLVKTGKGRQTLKTLKRKDSPLSPDDVIVFKDLASFTDVLLAGELDETIRERLGNL